MARILIVEDDLDLVETYTDLLESRHHQITSVMKAADAIRVVTRWQPAVVILDLNLPGDSGVMVLNLIRNYPLLANTKVIIATGHPEILEKTGYISSRADSIMCKPVSNDLLLTKIDEYLVSPSQK